MLARTPEPEWVPSYKNHGDIIKLVIDAKDEIAAAYLYAGLVSTKAEEIRPTLDHAHRGALLELAENAVTCFLVNAASDITAEKNRRITGKRYPGHMHKAHDVKSDIELRFSRANSYYRGSRHYLLSL